MSHQTEVPAAGESGGAQEAAETPPVAERPQNLTGADLTAEFSRARRTERTRRTAAKPSAPVTPKQPAPTEEPQGATPDPAAAAGQTVTTNSASAPVEPEAGEEQATALADLAAGDEPVPPPAEGQEPAPEESTAPEPEKEKEARSIGKMQKRIDKLTADLREKERLLAERAEQREPAPMAPEDTRSAGQGAAGEEYGWHEEVQSLDRQLHKANESLDWIEAHPEGGTLEWRDNRGQMQSLDFSAEQVATMRRNVGRQVGTLEAQRAAKVIELQRTSAQQTQEQERFVARRFPWLSDADSDGAALIGQLEGKVKAIAPHLLRLPGWRTWAAYAAEGIMADRQKQQRAGASPTPAPRSTPPRVAPPAASTAPKADPLDREIAEAEAEFGRTGRMKDYTRVETLKRQRRLKATAGAR